LLRRDADLLHMLIKSNPFLILCQRRQGLVMFDFLFSLQASFLRPMFWWSLLQVGTLLSDPVRAFTTYCVQLLLIKQLAELVKDLFGRTRSGFDFAL
jgi:hypothetical protein